MQFLKSKQNSSIFLCVLKIYESVKLNFLKKKIEIIGEEDKNKKYISIFFKSKKKIMQFKKIRTKNIYISIKIYGSVKLKIFFFS